MYIYIYIYMYIYIYVCVSICRAGASADTDIRLCTHQVRLVRATHEGVCHLHLGAAESIRNDAGQPRHRAPSLHCATARTGLHHLLHLSCRHGTRSAAGACLFLRPPPVFVFVSSFFPGQLGVKFSSLNQTGTVWGTAVQCDRYDGASRRLGHFIH